MGTKMLRLLDDSGRGTAGPIIEFSASLIASEDWGCALQPCMVRPVHVLTGGYRMKLSLPLSLLCLFLLAGCSGSSTGPTSPTVSSRAIPTSGSERDQWAVNFADANGMQINSTGIRNFGEGTCRNIDAGTPIDSLVTVYENQGGMKEHQAIVAVAVGALAYCPKYRGLFDEYAAGRKIALNYPQ